MTIKPLLNTSLNIYDKLGIPRITPPAGVKSLELQPPAQNRRWEAAATFVRSFLGAKQWSMVSMGEFTALYDRMLYIDVEWY